jgi:L-lactate dehydrogenase complex protein LldG
MTGPARAAILGRIREALGPSPAAPDVPRGYRQAGEALGAAGDPVELFAGRVAEYRASVHRAAVEGVGETIDAVIAARGGGRVVVPVALPWRPRGVELRVDEPPLSIAELDRVDSVVTGCAMAIAETGTIVLDGTGASGRRVLTLVPDHHVCVVGVEQIRAGVAEAIGALRPERAITFVSGPSATSDIELERVEGVHGPRVLDVIVVESP